ncbi:peptide chain release factor 1 [Candidatus Sumerlaeota bacterium]|nr:peptide chain release factor 1 [Candidatus Sumerlaeota bacterium]
MPSHRFRRGGHGLDSGGQRADESHASVIGRPPLQDASDLREGIVTTAQKISARERLASFQEHLRELENQLGSPEVGSDPKRMAELGREHAQLVQTIAIAQELVSVESRVQQAGEMLKDEKDSELRAMAEAELQEAAELGERLAEELQLRLLPPDPLDGRDILLEIRAGTGGDEAALFAGDLLRMYTRYAEKVGWEVQILSSAENDLGGFREVVLSVRGRNAYSHLKHESGAHRVQRIPQTETQGRIHTSAATVAVLPEAEETDVEIRDQDLRIDTMCSSGAGGQSVNTTYSAVRIVHLPTGLIVQCQDERSQLKNRAKAMTVLRTRLLDMKREEEMKARSDLRKNMVGSGDRSERIRTYNFPQNRVTDHRINLTLYDLDNVIEGRMDALLNALRKAELQKKLEGMAG